MYTCTAVTKFGVPTTAQHTSCQLCDWHGLTVCRSEELLTLAWNVSQNSTVPTAVMAPLSVVVGL